MKTTKQLASTLALALTVALFASCAGKKKAADKVKVEPPPVAMAPVATTAPVAPPIVPSVPAADHKEHIEKLAEKVTEHAASVRRSSTGTEPDKALQWLKNGNIRFVKGYWRKDGASAADVKRLTAGQKPHSIVLSCSDSRVPPEVIFDQKLGEIFVVRTAGESLDPMAIASIEYAVENFGSRNILVMGHTQCGAVKAAMATLKGGDAGSENLNKLAADIRPRIKEFAGKSPSPAYAAEGWANTKGVAEDLVKRSPLLSERLKMGDIKINSALYELDTGKVDFGSTSR